MNWKRILLSLVIVDFVALSAWVLFEHGIMGIWTLITANSVSILAAIDLCISLGILVGWMVMDARKRGLIVWPYVLLTCSLGSAGPLAYLYRISGRGVPDNWTNHKVVAASSVGPQKPSGRASV